MGTIEPDEIDRIRAAGFSQKDSQQSFGVTDITFPMYGPSGQAIATLTRPYLRRIDEYAAPTLDAVRAMLAEAASALSMVPETAQAGD
jgi:DNA-binding IclR family transcriptional regulator